MQKWILKKLSEKNYSELAYYEWELILSEKFSKFLFRIHKKNSFIFKLLHQKYEILRTFFNAFS